MPEQQTPPVGDVSREAVSSRRGYLYQDYQAAMRWLRVTASERLYLEVAEDYVAATREELVATQVKDLAKRLTLNDADVKQALHSFVMLVRENPRQNIRFAFLTTTEAGRERESRHRAGDEGSIAFWQSINSSEQIPALRKALLEIDFDREVHAFINARDDETLWDDLVKRFCWLLGQPTIDTIAEQLEKLVAARLYRTHQMPHFQGRKHTGAVLCAVQKASLRKRAERYLDAAALEELLSSLATRTVPADEYDRLIANSAIAENLPVDMLDQYLHDELLVLRKCRRFSSYDSLGASRSLARIVQSGGMYSGASSAVRAEVLAWAARVVLDVERLLAEDWLDAATHLCSTSEAVALTNAFLVAADDLPRAMMSLSALNSSAARTAQYLIQRRRSEGEAGAPVALAWLSEANFDYADLDEEGQAVLLLDLMLTQRWDDAYRLAAILDAQVIVHPLLLLHAALAHLTQAIPEERRHEVIDMPPLLNPLDFPLGIKVLELQAREAAMVFFERLGYIIKELNLWAVEPHVREYALWLSLHDHPEREDPRFELEERLKEPAQWLRWVPLALACKLPVDIPAALDRLWQHIAREGEPGPQGNRALLALVLACSPEPGSDLLRRAKPYLSKHFDGDMLVTLEAQMEIRAGRPDAAKAKLDCLPDSGPSLRMKRHLLSLIDAGSGDLVAVRRAAYESSPRVFELEQLVLALCQSRAWAELIPHAHALFTQVPTLENAELYIDALRRNDDWGAIEAFVDANPQLHEHSPLIADALTQVMLYRADWAALRDVLDNTALPADVARQRRRAMWLLSLQWNEFNAEFDAALKGDFTEEASELLELAVAAAILGRKADSQRLTQAAVAASPDDPSVLMNAYLHSVKGMWEGEESASWLKAAIDSSDPDGPVQAKSMKDLVDLAPTLRARDDQAWKNLQSGQLWLSAYAKMLNLQLSQTTICAANRNTGERDARRRTLIPAFSGARLAASLDGIQKVAIDATALLTLGRLGLLDSLKSAFDHLWVTHDVGLWLFDEFEKATFHQPRHFEDSRRIMGYLGQGKLSICPRLPVGDKLAAQIGEELTTLLRQAEADRADGKAAFVIRSSPVHLIDSMMDRNADLSAFAAVLRSTRCLAQSLKATGVIETEKLEAAELYLDRVDHGWPDEALIPLPEATLYVDELSITYLQHVGIFEDLIRTGCFLAVHEQVRTEAKSYEAEYTSDQALRQILVSIYDFLASGIASVKITVLPAPQQRRGRPDAQSTLGVDLMVPGLPVDAVLADDRFFNRFSRLEHSDAPPIQVITSLDVIDHLLSTEVIDTKRWRALRTNLRRAGYSLIPVTLDELREATQQSRLADNGQLVESADLRAIRENASLVQLRQILQVPAEMPWLLSFVESVRALLEDAWLGDLNDEDRISALTHWALGIIDMRNYAPSFPDPMPRERWQALGLVPLSRFLIACTLAEPSKKRRDLLAHEIFEGMEWRNPGALKTLLRLIISGLTALRKEMRESDDVNTTAALAQSITRLVSELPRPLERLMQNDGAHAAALGLELRHVIRLDIPEKPTFLRDVLWSAARAAVYDGGSALAIDNTGQKWTLTATEATGWVRVRDDLAPMDFTDVAFMSSNAAERTARLRLQIENSGIASDAVPSSLHDSLRERPLSIAEIDALQDFFALHPLPLFDELCNATASGQTKLNRIIPVCFEYYERIVGKWLGEPSISEFSLTIGSEPSEITLQNRLWLALLRCGHSSTGPRQLIAEANVAELKSFIGRFAQSLDVWSLTGLLEGLIARPDAKVQLHTEMLTLIRALSAATSGESSRLHLTAVLFMAVETRIRAHAPKDIPPYWRRLAAVAHGALIERVCLAQSVEFEVMRKRLTGLTLGFQAHGIIDMWREPKWAPFLLTDHQLQQELCGRVLNAWWAAPSNDAIADDLKQEIEVMNARHDAIAAAMPGPTEGNIEGSTPDPTLIAGTLDHLRMDELEFLNRWMMAASIALAENLSEEVLDTLNTQLVESGLSVLSGTAPALTQELLVRLAYVAAMNRNRAFAKTVLELTRRLFLEADGKIESYTCLYFGAVLSAAEFDLDAQKNALIECANFAANTCKDRTDALSCAHLLEGFVEAEWSLGPELVGAMTALRCVANSLG